MHTFFLIITFLLEIRTLWILNFLEYRASNTTEAMCCLAVPIVKQMKIVSNGNLFKLTVKSCYNLNLFMKVFCDLDRFDAML